MRIMPYVIFLPILFSSPLVIFAAPFLSFTPESPLQGEPVMISIEGIGQGTGMLASTSISFASTSLGVFLRSNKVTALYGVDLNKKPGTYTVTATLLDGTKLERDMTVLKRDRVEAPLGIPEKLGGNTTASQKTLVNTLALENASLLNLRTGTHAFWTKSFQYPVAKPVVTDDYGYSRQTGTYSIAHKGTDFRAVEGTPVMAMNRGVVRMTKTFRNYGKTIVVDHGLGLQTFYMHLSKIHVNVGELVLPGQVIGLSGQTGYAETAHLHLTVRLKDISIDPMKFIGLFKVD